MNVDALLEKINEYETELKELKMSLDHKDKEISFLTAENKSHSSLIQSLEAEMESQHENISLMSDQLNKKLEEKDNEHNQQTLLLKEKHRKELALFKNNQMDLDAQRALLNTQLGNLQKDNDKLQKEIIGLMESFLKSEDRS